MSIVQQNCNFAEQSTVVPLNIAWYIERNNYNLLKNEFKVPSTNSSSSKWFLEDQCGVQGSVYFF